MPSIVFTLLASMQNGINFYHPSPNSKINEANVHEIILELNKSTMLLSREVRDLFHIPQQVALSFVRGVTFDIDANVEEAKKYKVKDVAAAARITSKNTLHSSPFDLLSSLRWTCSL
ncbi:hypothetical protein MVEN_02255200 [Mycena venus]|uniref:Uncharacterized protein n=1 Tax=Mycena venus TaxID=2733690 RepID=A0A8H6X639_9AGAR|nr:hypothetical protein MVEN_02255200 [Mycena venus]